MEQKRATSSSPNIRKIPQVPPSPPKINNSPPTSPKILPKITTEQTSVTQKSSTTTTTTTISRLNQERSKMNRSSDSLNSPLTTTNHSFPTVNIPSNETMVMRYQTIQRYKSNFEILKPATVIAEEWRNLDKTQKDRLAIGGPKALVLVSKTSTPNKHIQVIQTQGHGAVASNFSSSFYQQNHQQNNWLVTGRQLTVVDTKTLGTWLKQRQQEQKQKGGEEEEEEINVHNEDKSINRPEKSSQSSSTNSSDSSSITTNGADIQYSNLTKKFQNNRSYSATLRGQRLLPDKPSIIKEIVNNNTTHPWEYEHFYDQPDPTGPLTKSALIYRLMRSRLEANLAKSISTNKNKSNQKKKLSSSTNT